MSHHPDIIINADDFGLAEAVNEGILECCRQGAVTSVSVLAAGEVFSSGAAALATRGDIGIGVHLCLNDERPVSAAGDVPGLVGPDGRFLKYGAFVRRILGGRIDLRQVYREWKAQIDRCIAAGLKPDHLDTHNHIHLFRPLFAVMVHLAEEYGIAGIRYCDPRLPGPVLPSPANIAKFLLASGRAGDYRSLPVRRIAYPGRSCGFYRGHAFTAAELRRCVERSPAGTATEIICHPGRGHSRGNPRYASWNYDWEQELRALCAVFGTGAADRPACRPVRFADIAPAGGQPEQHPGHSLSVVIPALNEFENIQKTVSLTRRYLERAFPDHEIIVVDDGSTDGTGEAAAGLLGSAGLVVRRNRREGYGAALRAGFARASREWIVYFDADYPVPVETLDEAMRFAGDYDMVIGYRTNSRADGLLRNVYRYGYALFIRALFGLRVKDINFAFKLFRKSAWDSLGVAAAGSFIDAELLIAARRKGLRIREIPVATLDRTFGASRLANFANIANIVREALAYYRRVGRKPEGNLDE